MSEWFQPCCLFGHFCLEDQLAVLFKRLFAVFCLVFAIGLKISLQVTDCLLSLSQCPLLHEIVEGCELVMIIFLELVLHQFFVESRVLSHLIDYFVVDWHRVESNNKPYYFRFNFPNFLEKFQLSYLRDSDPFRWIRDQHLLYNFNSINADITWEYVKPFNNLFIEFLCSLLLEGQSATNHSIEDNAQRPNITNDSIVRLTCHHFRRSVARTTTSSREQLPVFIVIRQPKVNEFDIVVSIQQYIFGFQVAMSNIKPVQILNGIQNLIENPASCSLLQSDLVGHHSEKLTLLGELIDDEHVICSLDDLVEIDYVRMPDFLHDVDLSLDADLVIFIFNAVLIDDLDGNFLASGDVNGFLDLSECALAKCLSELVISYSRRKRWCLCLFCCFLVA